MADSSIQLNAGSGGELIATDEISSEHYQIIKVTYGALGSQTIASSGAGATDAGTARVALASDSPGTEYILADDGAFTLTSSSVAMAGAIRDDTLSTLSAVEGDAVPLRVSSTGALHVTGASGATEFAEDSAHTTGDNGVQVLAVRNDTLAALCGTDGDYAPLQVSADGALFVEIAAGAGGTHIDDAAFTEASSDGVPIFGANGLGAINSGDAGVVAMTTDRSLHTVERPDTSGGISTVYRDEDIDETAVAVKAGAGQVYWIHVVNLDATPVYLHFYDVAQGSVTVGTTGELCSFCVPSQGDANGAGFTMPFPHGIEFGTAITAACTTTISGTSGPGTNEVILNVGYA